MPTPPVPVTRKQVLHGPPVLLLERHRVAKQAQCGEVGQGRQRVQVLWATTAVHGELGVKLATQKCQAGARVPRTAASAAPAIGGTPILCLAYDNHIYNKRWQLLIDACPHLDVCYFVVGEHQCLQVADSSCTTRRGGSKCQSRHLAGHTSQLHMMLACRMQGYCPECCEYVSI